MFKKFFFLCFLLTLTNCTVPGTALLCPSFTWATTKSATRTSATIVTTRIAKKLESVRSYTSIESNKIVKKLENIRFYQQYEKQ